MLVLPLPVFPEVGPSLLWASTSLKTEGHWMRCFLAWRSVELGSECWCAAQGASLVRRGQEAKAPDSSPSPAVTTFCQGHMEGGQGLRGRKPCSAG